jgi:hypothetical protein
MSKTFRYLVFPSEIEDFFGQINHFPDTDMMFESPRRRIMTAGTSGEKNTKLSFRRNSEIYLRPSSVLMMRSGAFISTDAIHIP